MILITTAAHTEFAKERLKAHLFIMAALLFTRIIRKRVINNLAIPELCKSNIGWLQPKHSSNVLTCPRIGRVLMTWVSPVTSLYPFFCKFLHFRGINLMNDG